MKQTVVDWLEERLTLSCGDELKSVRGFFVIAKEMEKEQMIHFAMDYVNSDSIGCLWDGDSAPELDIDTSAEQYYYRTFKTNEK